MGAPPPWTPVLPTPVGLGLASGLGPTRGGVAGVDACPLLKVSWGHIPHTLWEGNCPYPQLNEGQREPTFVQEDDSSRHECLFGFFPLVVYNLPKLLKEAFDV